MGPVRLLARFLPFWASWLGRYTRWWVGLPGGVGVAGVVEA